LGLQNPRKKKSKGCVNINLAAKGTFLEKRGALLTVNFFCGGIFLPSPPARRGNQRLGGSGPSAVTEAASEEDKKTEQA